MGLPRVIEVQHHHAHVAAVAGEHEVRDPVIGITFDGTGYGDDGHVWGAEILLADLVGYRRLARLRYAPMPGGDRAARSPWRVAAGYASLDPDRAGAFENAFRGVDPTERRIVEAQIDRNVNAPLASSMGRLFDAAAAVLGVRSESLYEGQAAMELEALASRYLSGPGTGEAADADAVDRVLSHDVLASLPDLAFPEAGAEGGVRVLDPLPLLAELGERGGAGEDAGRLAAAFHACVGGATVELTAALCADHGIERVAMGGGVFQNALLLAIVRHGLEARGLVALSPRRLSPNDGAISYGQAVVAAARLAAEHGR
jgi:hydrogenase maturation protein HypF